MSTTNDSKKISVIDDVTEKITGLSLEELAGGSSGALGLCCIANSNCNKNTAPPDQLNLTGETSEELL